MGLFQVIILIPILSILFCKGDKNASNDKLGALLGVSPIYNTNISSVSPQQGAPAIQTENVQYTPTKIKISGKNFSFIPSELEVTFNGVKSNIDFSSDKEIYTTVPTGATTGLLMVRKNGGVCTSFDQKSGNNCSATNFYIDCYSSYKNTYGPESLLKLGEITNVDFDSNGTKAFRVELPLGNYSLNVSCLSTVIVQRFSNSCVSTTETNNGTSLLINPQIKITGGYTMQFFLTTTRGTCTVGVFN